MAFTCTARQSDQRVMATITGDVDLAAYPVLQAEADSWTGTDTDVVLDCSQVTFMDSMGLRVLVQIHQTVTDASHTLTLTDPSTPVLRVLELAGVQQLFGCVHRQAGTAAEATAT